jgi:hypothetical protein
MPARNPPKNGRPWTPEKVRDRIRIGLIMSRLEKQALAELDPKAKKGADSAMTPAQMQAAIALMHKCLPNAEAPRDINLNGNITVIDRDPTQRPDGYERRAPQPKEPT